MNVFVKAAGGLVGALLFAGAVATYKSTTSFQMGYPGVGMEVINTRASMADKVAANAIPITLPAASQDGQLAVDAYKNVEVLGNLSSGEFTRLMTAMTIWVAPDAGCGYCHAPERDVKGNVVKNEEGYPQADLKKMDSDELYPKRVARRMLQMTQRLNGEWKDHVKATGVTCYTCHRGNPVPANIWFDEPENDAAFRAVGNKEGQNAPSPLTGYTSLPNTSFRPFLAGDENIRIQSTEAIGSPNRSSIKQTEWTYSLMIHFSNALGVNCTYCHNTRSMGEWSTSPSTRSQAYYGIRMVREINKEYLEPLLSTFPPERLGPTGDTPKANCATCHNGAYKPLLGVSMLKDYQALAEAKPQPAKTLVPTPQGDATADGGTTMMLPDGGMMNATGVPVLLPDGGLPASTDAGTMKATLDGGPGGPSSTKQPLPNKPGAPKLDAGSH